MLYKAGDMVRAKKDLTPVGCRDTRVPNGAEGVLRAVNAGTGYVVFLGTCAQPTPVPGFLFCAVFLKDLEVVQ